MRIIVSQDKKRATVHFDTHSVNLSSDTDVTELIHEMWIEPELRLIRSFEDTQWIITLPEVA